MKNRKNIQTTPKKTGKQSMETKNQKAVDVPMPEITRDMYTNEHQPYINLAYGMNPSNLNTEIENDFAFEVQRRFKPIY